MRSMVFPDPLHAAVEMRLMQVVAKNVVLVQALTPHTGVLTNAPFVLDAV